MNNMKKQKNKNLSGNKNHARENMNHNAAGENNKNNNININWYPGHMAKTRRMIQENLKLVDAVCEILDARIPASSRNPDMNTLTAGKPRLMIFNRADQADPESFSPWADFYRNQDIQINGANQPDDKNNINNIIILRTDAKSGRGVNQFAPAVRELLADKIKAWTAKGQSGHVIRVMILGVPNVGKSSFINRVSGRNSAKAENRPGVTRGKQWIVIDKQLELLDTPGMLWPKFEDQAVGERLAWTGAIKDDILDLETLGSDLAAFLAKYYPGALLDGYKLDALPNRTEDQNIIKNFNQNQTAYGFELLKLAGAKRGFRISGGEIDTERMARTLLDEFRSGKLGRFTLEFPENAGE